MTSSWLAVSLLTIGVAPAWAETVNCVPITTVPAVITMPGVYCFTKSLVTSMASGNAIEIQAHNVVLDMNGHRLGGLGAGLSTEAFGIRADNRQNITIKNGTIRGFLVGLALQDSGASQGHLVEDMRADQNRFIGMAVQGTGSIIRNNQVVATGGSTSASANGDAAAIYAVGTGVRVLNNDVVSVVPVGGDGYGISLDGGGGLAVDNRITGAPLGIFYEAGATGKYRNTLTSDVATPYTGGTNAGNNN